MSSPLTVLAIDDDRDELTLLRHHLGRFEQPVELLAFDTPDEGLEALSKTHVDVVLIDNYLGPCRGVDLLPEIQLRAPDAPVILWTDQGDEELATEALSQGFADYLPKHVVSTKSLRRSMTNAIEKVRLRRALIDYRTDLERSVKELTARNEEIRNFYHTLSHELKTPLTAAREFVSIVLDGLQGPLTPDQRESLATSRDACDQLARCLNDLLDASRLETGKLALHAAPADLTALVDGAITHYASLAREKGILLDRCAPEGLPEACVDSGRVTQVLQNLIGNALKFTSSGGTVRVTLSQHRDEGEDAIRIAVADTGRGIEPLQQERIFERLHQADEEDSATHGGLGLGLNLCRELVLLHGGEISVESVVGEGSTFFVTLPIEPATARQQPV